MLLPQNVHPLSLSGSLICGGLILGAVVTAPAQGTITVQKLFGELDPYTPPGQSQTTIEGLGNLNANAIGGYTIRGRTFPPFDNTGAGVIYGRPDAGTADAYLHEETDITIGPDTYYREGFGSTSVFNTVGQLAYESDFAFSDSFGSPQFDSIWIDNVPQLVEGDAISGIPGQSFDFFGLVQFNDAGTLFYKGRYGGNKSGLFSGTGTPILKVGDVLGGTGDTVLDNDIGSFGNVRMSRDGSNYMTELDVNPAVWTPQNPFNVVTDLLVLNGNAAAFASDPTAYLKQGDLIPAADGGLGDAWNGSFGDYAVNSSGKWGTTGDTDAATNDAIIVVDGVIVAREGDILPTESGGTTTLAGSAKAIEINEQGDVVYTFGDSIFINGIEVLTLGAMIDNGETLSRIQSGLAISDRDINDEITVFFIGRGLVNSAGIADTAYSFQFTLDPLTLPGDLNGDGFVGLDDLDIILQNWNLNIPPGNPLADPTGDNFVGLDDLDIVLQNWNTGTPPPPGLADIPEPGTLCLLSVGGAMLARRSRR